MPLTEISGYQLSVHAQAMLQERGLDMHWIESVLNHPEWSEIGKDGNYHYIKSIREFGGRRLRVVVNAAAVPPKIITIFFDRRLKEKK